MRSLCEHFLVDDDQDEQDENSDDSTGYEALLVHPKFKETWNQWGDERGVISELYAYRRTIFLSVPEALSIDTSAPCSYKSNRKLTKRKVVRGASGDIPYLECFQFAPSAA